MRVATAAAVETPPPRLARGCVCVADCPRTNADQAQLISTAIIYLLAASVRSSACLTTHQWAAQRNARSNAPMLGPPPLLAGQCYPSHGPPRRRRPRVEACGAFVGAVRRSRSSSSSVLAASVQAHWQHSNHQHHLPLCCSHIHTRQRCRHLGTFDHRHSSWCHHLSAFSARPHHHNHNSYACVSSLCLC